MKSSFQRNNKGGIGRLVLTTLVFAAIILVDLLSGGVVRDSARALAANIWGIGARASAAVFHSGTFSSARALAEENRLLKSEVAELRARLAGIATVEEDARALRALAKLATEEDGVGAPIISSLFSSPYGTLLVGAGSDEGVEVGDLVLSGDGGRGSFVVGRVRDVGRHRALVDYALAPGTRFEGVIGGATLQIEGAGGRNARAEAPDSVLIESGDPVIVSEFGGRAVGIVGSISHDVANASNDIFINLPVDLGVLRYVYVIPFSP